MNKNEQFVITINRELGSGGRTIGRLLAEKLGVPFYDKAVIKALQEKYHLTTAEIERMKGRKHSWWADVERILKIDGGMSMNYYLPTKTDAPDLITTDEMFKTETLILQDLAAEKSCVVAGRSGFHVFRDHPNHLSILIQAKKESRIARLVRKRGITSDEARKIIDEVDLGRENYVKKYTGTSRYDTRNYDLVINMSDITEDDAVDLIMDYINKSNQ